MNRCLLKRKEKTRVRGILSAVDVVVVVVLFLLLLGGTTLVFDFSIFFFKILKSL